MTVPKLVAQYEPPVIERPISERDRDRSAEYETVDRPPTSREIEDLSEKPITERPPCERDRASLDEKPITVRPESAVQPERPTVDRFGNNMEE